MNRRTLPDHPLEKGLVEITMARMFKGADTTIKKKQAAIIESEICCADSRSDG